MTTKPDSETDVARMSAIASGVQALLFSEGGPMTYKKLASILACNEAELMGALDTLSQTLSRGGLALVRSDTEAALVIAPIARDAVLTSLTEELERDIGDAGLEVLAIVLYEGSSTRANIDYIRGVNSSSTIRTLLARGLLERSGNPEDGREYIYKPTTELLAHLGAEKKEALVDYDTIVSELKSFSANQESPETSFEPAEKNNYANREGESTSK